MTPNPIIETKTQTHVSLRDDLTAASWEVPDEWEAKKLAATLRIAYEMGHKAGMVGFARSHSDGYKKALQHVYERVVEGVDQPVHPTALLNILVQLGLERG